MALLHALGRGGSGRLVRLWLLLWRGCGFDLVHGIVMVKAKVELLELIVVLLRELDRGQECQLGL